MGNTPSVEAPGKGSRATQKLSKPRTGNPATAGLLNPKGVSDIIHRPPSAAGRRLSLPYSSAPVPSPRYPDSENTVADDLRASHEASPLVEDFSTRSLLQSDSQGALSQGSQSVGVVASSSRGRRMSRTNSVYMGADEGYESRAVLPRDTSRSSVNYNLSSYEARRLLNLTEAPPFEDRPVASEGQLQGALSRRQSYTPSYYPAHSDVAIPLPRTSSGTSLYTPMRRRSLMTPGVATRPAPADLAIPLTIQTRPSPPPKPSCSDPSESMGVGFLSVSHSSFDPSLTPRAHTPCEADYKQTGAFKHGTLRITNGSPARTPAWETPDHGLRSNSLPAAVGQGNYFDAGNQVQEQYADSNSSQCPAPACLTTTLSPTSASNLATVIGGHEAAIDFLPELKLTMSPFSIGEIQPELLELQTTSKNTAIEDELFEDSSPEYGTEVLNVRLDHDAKPHPFSPSASLEEGKPKRINRPDSGIVASPVSGVPKKSLSKADSGYSSSVSIRSLSSKRTGRREIDHSRNLEAVSPQTSHFEYAKLSGNISIPTRSATAGPPEMQVQSPLSDEPPPPVPEKDDRTKVPKHVTAQSNDSWVPTGKPGLLPNRVFASETPKLSHHSALGPNNPPPISALSVGNARKPGRLQRFLSGARVPLTVHATHDLDREVGVPPVPREVREKLHARAGLSPNSLEGSLESKETQKENSQPTTVNNLFLNHEHDSAIRAAQNRGSSARTDHQDKIRGFKSSFHVHSISSTITRAASSVMAKNPISRKSTLSRTLSRTKPDDDVDAIYLASDTPATTTQHPSSPSQWHQQDLENMNSISVPSTVEKERYGGQAATTDRSNSLSASIRAFNSTIYDDAHRSSLASQSEQHAISFRKRSFPGQYLVSRTPPPVSMKTRSMGPLRVPLPIRPRSTPPVRSVAPTLSRKPSREGVQSYPPYNYPMNSNPAALSRQSSQEGFYTYSTAQIQAFLNQPSQMPGVIPWGAQPHLGEYRGLSGIKPKYGMAPSWEPSFDHSRRSSLASQTSHRSALSNGQPWSHYSPYDAPTLKHRSSYDGYSFQARQGYGQENGPHLSSNGQTINSMLDTRPMDTFDITVSINMDLPCHTACFIVTTLQLIGTYFRGVTNIHIEYIDSLLCAVSRRDSRYQSHTHDILQVCLRKDTATWYGFTIRFV
ncbi:hypothetical protein E0Z10_g3888 [Xylaria hypoxylon]|uniref:Uncharacterized protein n=1 Tax=Xylaria hypoxylon TaxID=37992 RepID=A0A4Z0Z8K3_9PEZI|nr:hypothetical protein E0Z10_g3888 [Xylaria hypoxylon]